MFETRPGCYYCFRDLASDREQDSAVALTCSTCGCLHHPDCWQVAQSCSRCGGNQTEQTIVAMPPAAPIIDKRQSLPIEPTAVIYLVGSRVYTSLRLRAIVLIGSLALLSILVLAGVGFYAVTTLMARAPFGPTPTLTSGSPLVVPSALPSVTPDLPATPAPPVATVIADGLSRVQFQDVNLRSGPGQEQERLAILLRGVQVQVLNESQLVGDSIWVKVQAGQLTGWVNQRYLLHVRESDTTALRARVAGVAPEPLHVRSEPSGDAQIIDRLSEGSEVILLDVRENGGVRWQHIQIDQTNGWVDATFLEQIP